MRPEEPDTCLDSGLDAGSVERAAPYLTLTLDSSPLSVRRTLLGMRRDLVALTVGAEAAGTIEIVLAEVMNNVGEHAYGGASGGEIALSMWIEGETLAFEVRDRGRPMPGGALPAGMPVAVDCPVDLMPEGGFGWHLIRVCTTELSYRRVGGWNRLSFRMRRDAQPADDPTGQP